MTWISFRKEFKAMFKSSAFIYLLLVSVANCQFFYNVEEEDAPSEQQNYDQSAYQYNPPETVNQQYLQPSSNENTPINENGNRRTRIRVRSRNYQSEPEYNDSPAVNTDIDRSAIRQERRQARRRQRQNDYLIQPAAPPRIFGPSVFENIGIGEAPSGVYIPADSFLNVLKNQRPIAPRSNSQPVVTVSQSTDYAQPRFFVQPPSNDEPRRPNLILPVTRPAVEYTNAPLPQPMVIPTENSARAQARLVRGNRRSRPKMRIQAEPAPPTVDIDALREYSDDIARENVMSQVQYAPQNSQRNSRSQSRRREVRNYQEITPTPAPRVYSPSIFEKVGLGEAPSGVYVPEDSLLNILRNPSRQHHLSHRVSQQEPKPQLAYSIPDEFEEELVDDQYQRSLPPPPPPVRRAPSRSRQTARTSRPQRQEYQNDYEEYQDAQPVQTFRSRRRNNDYEEFERQKPAVQRQAQAQRIPPVTTVSRTQSQPLTSDTNQSSKRIAKLAIAELPEDTDDDGIPGEAGVNYPTLHVIPKTSFSCVQQPHNGYYADLETSCQVVHLCQSGGVQSSFLCPNGTIFSQEKFSCQWWYKVNCNDAPRYYAKNDELYKVPEKMEKKRN